METPVITIVREDGLGEENPAFVIDGTRWFLEDEGLENFDGVEHSVSTADYAQYDGAYLLSERSPAIDRTIVCRSTFDADAARREAERFFVPRRSFSVHVSYAGRARYCVGRQYGFRLETKADRGSQGLTWTVLSLDPYWLSEDEKRFDIAEGQGRRGFSHCSFVSRVAPEPGRSAGAESHVAGFVVGVISKEIWMENQGGTTCYPRFDVSAFGHVANPVLRIVDRAGEELMYVALTVDLEEGDELVVDFSERPTSILLNGENASHLVRPGSTLAAGIEPGRFRVEWSADEGDAALRILPSIRERYASI